MARTTAPLLGFSAEGQIAKTMVYGTWRGVKYARRYVVPGNPRTVAQQLTRTTFATLRKMWKLSSSDGRAPWTAYATGRPFLNLNAFLGENMKVVRGDANFNDFLGSPGARGGLPPESVTAVAGAAGGSVDVSFTIPAAPVGWVHLESVAVAFPDQNPALDFVGPLRFGKVANPVTTIPVLSLGSAVPCQISMWLVWTKPNGQLAYSVGITNTATSSA